MKNEKGFVLIIVLLFLLVLSLLGIAVMGESVLEEKMASNMEQQVIALSAAESGLAVCEDITQAWVALPTFDITNGTDGLHVPSSNSTEVGSPESLVWDTSDIILYTMMEPALAGVTEQPVCIIEHLKTVAEIQGGTTITKELFRISAEGTGATDSAIAYAQSIVTREF